jgi:hypothetical protein
MLSKFVSGVRLSDGATGTCFVTSSSYPKNGLAQDMFVRMGSKLGMNDCWVSWSDSLGSEVVPNLIQSWELFLTFFDLVEYLFSV